MITRYLPKGHKSDAVVCHGIAYLSGLASRDMSLGLSEQVKDTLEQIDELLAKCGSDKQRLLMATIWLADPTQVRVLNDVWNEWVVPGKQPARACVGATLQKQNMLVEIAVTASVDPAVIRTRGA